jgi:histidyl-tRNA synthetase
MFGSHDASADADCIKTAVEFVKSLGLDNLFVEINSLGCNDCRSAFREKIKSLIKPFLSELCDDCKRRYETNPLRILDCKNKDCLELLEKNNVLKALSDIDLCDDCNSHFENLKEYLDILNVKYIVNPLLVRGLDYYTRTVFEIKSNALGSQNAVCGGGRYDNLVETLGGVSTPAVGWAVGVERLCLLTKKPTMPKIDYFVISDKISVALKFADKIRSYGKSAESDYSSRKFSKQIEKAAKIANNAVILGENEILSNKITVKNLETFEQITILQDDFFISL